MQSLREGKCRLDDCNVTMMQCISSIHIHESKSGFILLKTAVISLTWSEVKGYPKLSDLMDFWCLMPLSAIFQLYHGDQSYQFTCQFLLLTLKTICNKLLR